jgi:hypothetical protein
MCRFALVNVLVVAAAVLVTNAALLLGTDPSWQVQQPALQIAQSIDYSRIGTIGRRLDNRYDVEVLPPTVVTGQVVDPDAVPPADMPALCFRWASGYRAAISSVVHVVRVSQRWSERFVLSAVEVGFETSSGVGAPVACWEPSAVQPGGVRSRVRGVGYVSRSPVADIVGAQVEHSSLSVGRKANSVDANSVDTVYWARLDARHTVSVLALDCGGGECSSRARALLGDFIAIVRTVTVYNAEVN